MPRDSVEGRLSGASSLPRAQPVPAPAPCQRVPPSRWGGQGVPASLATLLGTGPVPWELQWRLGLGGSGGSPGASAPWLCGVSAVTHPANHCLRREGPVLGREARGCLGVMETAGPWQLPPLLPVPRAWVPVRWVTRGPSGASVSPRGEGAAGSCHRAAGDV